MQDLGTLGGNNSTAVAISNSGRVVGFSDTAAGQRHAFGWDSVAGEPVMTDLNDLLPEGSEWTLIKGIAINDDGDIVAHGRRGRYMQTLFIEKN